MREDIYVNDIKICITDSDQYNELIDILNVLGSEKWKISEDDTEI